MAVAGVVGWGDDLNANDKELTCKSDVGKQITPLSFTCDMD